MSGWTEVSADAPCAVCGKTTWCSVSIDGALAICHRTQTSAGERRTDKNGAEYWLYRLSDAPAKRRTVPDYVTEPERAAPEDLDRVYRRLLGDLVLSPGHRDDLKRRGLDDAAIDAGMYRSMPRPGRNAIIRRLVEAFGEGLLLRVPGIYRDDARSGGDLRLAGACGPLIPVRDADGHIVALKVRRDDDNDGPRYTYLSSKRHGGPGPGAPVHVPVHGHAKSQEGRWTEGEIKSDVATFISKLLTIGSPGAAHWRAAMAVFKKLDIHSVRLAFDADSRTNFHVGHDLSEAKSGFVKEGFEVFEETWPSEWGKGIDDVLAAGHTPNVVRVSPDVAVDEPDEIDAADGAEGRRPAPPDDADRPPVERGAAVASGFSDRIVTDITIAQEFIKVHGEDVRFVESLGEWFLWNGRRWKVDDTNAVLTMAAVIARRLTIEFGSSVPPAIKNALLRQEQKPRLVGALAVAAAHPDIALRVEDLDRDPWLLCCKNGTVDLRTGTLRPHQREDLITRRVPHEFDATAACLRWIKFLDEVTNKRTEIVQFLRRFIGYCLTAEVVEHALLLLIGVGCNGKSVFVELLMYLLGRELATPAPPGLLLVQRGERHPTEIMHLRSRRLVVASEVPKSGAFSEERVKWLTGGDELTGRGMRQDFVTFAPSHKFVICANHMPRVNDASDGFWRRVRVVPFDVSFKGREDRGLLTALKAEAPAILAWAVGGGLEWQRGGLGAPIAVTEATSTYRSDEDLVGRFLAERAVSGEPNADVPMRDLFAAFKAWCDANGETAHGGSKQLGKDLVAHGWSKRHSNRGNVWSGPRTPPEPPEGGPPTDSGPGGAEPDDDGAGPDTYAPRDDPTADDRDWLSASEGERVNHGEPSDHMTSIRARARARIGGGTSLRVHHGSPFTGTTDEEGAFRALGGADAADDAAPPATIDAAPAAAPDAPAIVVGPPPRQPRSAGRSPGTGRWPPCPADTGASEAADRDDALFQGGVP